MSISHRRFRRGFWGITPASFLTIALTFVIPNGVLAFSFGPPDGRTGAPGEQTCHAAGCHDSFDLNSGAGVLTIDVPENYIPGEGYEILVNRFHPDQSRWGFELTVLTSDGSQVGTLAPTDGDTQVSETGIPGRRYIKHTSDGTSLGTAHGRSWSFQWTAPDSDVGPVTFYAASNAANGNFAPSGDFIRTSTAESHSKRPEDIFLRGDCNDDGNVNLSDAVCSLEWLFRGAGSVGCVAVVNANGDSGVDISDAVFLLIHLFLDGPPPAQPFPDCGPGALAADEELGCETVPKNSSESPV